ncbi:DUF4959 domain-containing protein [Chitinophaga sedimenti]|uniref:DUF5000 domain-containing lipoprotein n=1 Tax=Chitinophaga sedimenti TaxID=2033606 RepID=UPI0020065D2A|nr:DUF5000 domain-containing lipoprotein [Chitinophaga sedimenti]MCK7556451.1 DUF4959 domain-containing protein [Chitinophaga sedimenti]
MKRYIKMTSWALLAAAFFGCEREQLKPLESAGGSPAPVSNVTYESLPGAVKMTYSLPADKDLLYVQAVYTNKYGKEVSVKASYYTNSITVEGFADTAKYKMKLYAVNRSENKSAASEIEVKANTPPVYDAFKTVQLKEDFGGVNIHYNNPSEADLAVVVCYKDSTGAFVLYETFYSKQKEGNFTSRGFPSEQTEFAVYLRDRWDNRTDTVFQTMTPIFEKELDKSKFRAVVLPTDIAVGWGLPIPNLWNGKIAAEGEMWHSADGAMPMHVSFDLGVTAKLSRFVLWQRRGVWIYNHGNPRHYEVWGSVNPPSDGSWNNWEKLVECTSVKPSGQPTGMNTTEDVEAAARGEEFNIPLTAPKVRYIRVKVLDTWIGKGGQAAHISEMTFYGNDK